jgi:hypothetical protein
MQPCRATEEAKSLLAEVQRRTAAAEAAAAGAASDGTAAAEQLRTDMEAADKKVGMAA